MVCKSDKPGASTSKPEVVKDWSVIHPYTPDKIFDPADREELVRAIVDGESSGGGMKAQGACYAPSKAQVADKFLIRTGQLNQYLSKAFSGFGDIRKPPADRMRSGREHDIIHPRTGLVAADGCYVHVEAGVQIKTLLAELNKMRLALPTMGSGGLQTLAGALSTGTHNADVALQPLVDSVRAIHLVGPGGQEWWIEPSAGFAARPELTQLTGWCPGTNVVCDDDFFNAALVAVGRFGVIYALVLELPSKYWLIEQAKKRKWTEIAAKLKKGAKPDGNYFDEGGMFAGKDLRFCELVKDLGRDVCWVTRRWNWHGPDEKGLEKPTPGIIGTFCHKSALLVPYIQAAHPAFMVLVGQVLAVPFVGIGWAARIQALLAQLMTWAGTSSTIGNFLSKMVKEVNGLNEAEVGFVAPELKAIVQGIVSSIFDGEFSEERVGPSHKILDGHNYGRDGCMSVNCCEFFFDALDDVYLAFMKDVNAAASKSGFLPGYASLRFMKGSKALLAPQQYDLSVAIEIAVPRSTDDGDLYGEFFEDVLDIAHKHHAIPHWGLQHRLSPPRLQKLYGDKLEAWRWALAEIEAGHPPTFSSAFTRKCGLELEEGKALKNYRSQRSAGVMVASCLPLFFS